MEALGIDVGGVIISRATGTPDTFRSKDAYLEIPEVPGATDTIRRLVSERFEDRVYLVSKCGPRVQAKTRRWLKHHRFYERTGVSPKHVYFCLERSEKAEICRRLNITHFIDDRPDVLNALQNVDCLLFDSDVSSSARLLSSIRVVVSWNEVAQILLAKRAK